MAEARAALRALARLHGFFWEGGAFWARGGEAAAELRGAVWPSGAYWQPSMQTDEQWAALADKYALHARKLGARFLDAPELRGIAGGLGARLQAVARAAADAAHPFDPRAGAAAAADAARYRTVVHGDPKAANLFFRPRAKAAGDDAGGLEVGMIDLQWAGFGLAATDVAHR